MEFVEVRDLAKYVGAVASVRGWVDSKRSHGKVAFIDLRDGTGLVQCVLVKKQLAPEAWDLFGELTQEASVLVTGETRAEPRAADTQTPPPDRRAALWAEFRRGHRGPGVSPGRRSGP